MFNKIKLFIMKLINKVQNIILKIEIWLFGKDTNKDDEDKLKGNK